MIMNELQTAASYPIVTNVVAQLTKEVGSSFSGEGAKRCATLAHAPYDGSNPPYGMLGLSRAFNLINYTEVKALGASALLLAASVYGHTRQGAEGHRFAVEALNDFGKLYLPVATQRPALALNITSAALSEPNLPPMVRDKVMLSFADASFSLLRSAPETSASLLRSIAHELSSPHQSFVRASIRAAVVKNLAFTLHEYAPNYTTLPDPVTYSGAPRNLSHQTAIVVAETLAQLSTETHERTAYAVQAQRSRAKLEKI